MLPRSPLGRSSAGRAGGPLLPLLLGLMAMTAAASVEEVASEESQELLEEEEMMVRTEQILITESELIG